jgi:hypothetical protein
MPEELEIQLNDVFSVKMSRAEDDQGSLLKINVFYDGEDDQDFILDEKVAHKIRDWFNYTWS